MLFPQINLYGSKRNELRDARPAQDIMRELPSPKIGRIRELDCSRQAVLIETDDGNVFWVYGIVSEMSPILVVERIVIIQLEESEDT